MELRIDRDRCTGHGRCYSLAPELFDCDDEGFGRSLHDVVPEGLLDRARTAADACPERAVLLG